MKCDRCGYSDNGTGDWAHACGPVSIQRAPVANTRIQELAEQATVYHNGGLGTEIESFDKEKFAELIVRECYVALFPALRDMISRGQAYDMIRQHFGVEE